MDITGLLTALRERALWHDGRRVIVNAGLGAGQGWERTLARYAGEDVDNGKADALAAGLIQHILSAEKVVQIYDLEEQEVDVVRSWVQRQVVPNSAFSVAFPESVDITQLSARHPVLVANISDGDGDFLVYTVIREYDVREPVSLDGLSDAVKRAIGEFTSLVGMKKVRHQVFDVLWVPPAGRAVVAAADAPKEMPFEFALQSHSKLRSAIAEALGTRSTPVNLYYAIKNLYLSDLGKVARMSFVTDTGSVKQEHMRQDCLRVEPFHVGGSDAVSGAIHPYSISVKWDSGTPDELEWSPELTIHGRAALVSSTDPRVYEAVLRNSLNVGDMRVLVDNLMALAAPTLSEVIVEVEPPLPMDTSSHLVENGGNPRSVPVLQVNGQD